MSGSFNLVTHLGVYPDCFMYQCLDSETDLVLAQKSLIICSSNLLSDQYLDDFHFLVVRNYAHMNRKKFSFF